MISEILLLLRVNQICEANAHILCAHTSLIFKAKHELLHHTCAGEYQIVCCHE